MKQIDLPKLDAERKPYLRLRRGRQTRSSTTSFNSLSGAGPLTGGIEIGDEYVLPCQWQPGRKRRQEHQLMFAVLEGAVLDIHRGVSTPSRRCAQFAREALAWVEEGESTWPFSFLNICEMLELEPAAIRRYARKIASGVPCPACVIGATSASIR